MQLLFKDVKNYLARQSNPVDSTPKCNSQGPRALAVDGLRDQGER